MGSLTVDHDIVLIDGSVSTLPVCLWHTMTTPTSHVSIRMEILSMNARHGMRVDERAATSGATTKRSILSDWTGWSGMGDRARLGTMKAVLLVRLRVARQVPSKRIRINDNRRPRCWLPVPLGWNGLLRGCLVIVAWLNHRRMLAMNRLSFRCLPCMCRLLS